MKTYKLILIKIRIIFVIYQMNIMIILIFYTDCSLMNTFRLPILNERLLDMIFYQAGT